MLETVYLFVISTLRLPERKQVGLTGTMSDE
jgi:hypothetical protein